MQHTYQNSKKSFFLEARLLHFGGPPENSGNTYNPLLNEGLSYNFEPNKKEAANTPENEQTDTEKTFKYPITILGEASKLMQERGVKFSDANLLTTRNINFRIDDNTKKIEVYSHRNLQNQNILYIRIININGPSDIVSVDDRGEVDVKTQEEEKKPETALASLIDCKNDRGWMKEIGVDSTVVNQLLIAKKAGITLSDNFAKSQGFNVMKDNAILGQVIVFNNENWQRELSTILNKELSKPEREKELFVPIGGPELLNGDVAVKLPGIKGYSPVFRMDAQTNTYKCLNVPGSYPQGVTAKELQQMLKFYDSIIIAR